MTKALVFPGQGAHGPEMLQNCPEQIFRSALWQQLCELLKCDPRKPQDSAYFSRNEVASLLTVFLSMLALEENPAMWESCEHYAGYSVGQVSALYAAGLLKKEEVLPVVFRRAQAMNACLKNTPESGMLACIGLSASVIAEVIQQLQLTQTTISNYNAPGQVSIAGAIGELMELEKKLRELKPRKLLHIPTEGAWHSPWMRTAQPVVEQLFSEILKPPFKSSLKIACNVSGQWLNLQHTQQLAHSLGRQVAEAVQWEACVRTLIGEGVTEFIEMGYGTVLTRFGFFIDRSLVHRHWQS